MRKKKESENSIWIHEFENLYLVSYQALYRHAKLLLNQEDKTKELMILIYMEAYQRQEQITKEKDPLVWLLKRSDFLAESKMNVTKEMIEASYAEERMQSKEAKKENLPNLDETSLLLEIEEKLGIEEEPDSSENKGLVQTAMKGILSFVLLAVALIAVAIGIVKARGAWEEFRRSSLILGESVQDLNSEEEVSQEICIQVGEEAVYLSEIGQILYSLPLEESGLSSEVKENPEIQKQTGWTYYLPCPEREDTQLPDVSPELYHTLYRMQGDGHEIDIIAREVDNYAFWEDGIYIFQFGHVRRIDANDPFEKKKTGIFVKEKDDEFYIYDDLGRMLETDNDGSVTIGDRVFKMSSNRILDVEPAVRKKGQATYFLWDTEDGAAIFVSKNGREELFEANGKNIDCFCIAGDWMYYSTCTRIQRSGSNYSELYRKSLVRDGEAEQLGKRILGRMYQMYYSQTTHLIYADYVPKSWKNNHGLIAVIALDGTISYLDDEELREGTETTGNDWLRFVTVQNGNVYCYWEDCLWERNEMPKAMWRKTLVIPNENRILLEE